MHNTDHLNPSSDYIKSEAELAGEAAYFKYDGRLTDALQAITESEMGQSGFALESVQYMREWLIGYERHLTRYLYAHGDTRVQEYVRALYGLLDTQVNVQLKVVDPIQATYLSKALYFTQEQHTVGGCIAQTLPRSDKIITAIDDAIVTLQRLKEFID